MGTIQYERDDGDIVTLTLDDPEASANTMNDRYIESMADTVDRLVHERDAITGVVITSAKKTFFAGADLKQLIHTTPEDAPEIFERIERVKHQLRRLETLGRPVVAAINGAALGGGLEIALACHHRIAVDGPGEIGLPEVTLGLLPGGGGITRTVRMFGLQSALMDILIKGSRMKPARAKQAGLVDDLVDSIDALVPAAKQWILDHRDDPAAATQPWDRDGYRMPGGTPSNPKLAQLLPAFTPMLRQQLKGAPYPAPRAILSAAVEGAQVDFDTASRIESRYLTKLITGQIFKNMTQAFFFDLGQINAGGSRPKDVPRFQATRVGVLGAGMMGAGIAYSYARAGVDVELLDVSTEAAEKGKAHSAKLLAKQVGQGRLTDDKRGEILSRITPTDKMSDLTGCDVVIEAVFESSDLKHQLFQQAEEVVGAGALLCSNTSTLPITGLATAVKRSDDFIGLHFFSPVDKMPLVEIIKGEETSNDTLARAYDIVLQIKKTPIVVNDSRGFFTSRVFGALVMEGAAMVSEGIAGATIEHAATQKGFPAPPLAMIDEVTLTLPLKIQAEAAADAGAGASTFGNESGLAVVRRMVEEFGRTGKAARAGFYEYPADAPKYLWPGLAQHFGGQNVGSRNGVDVNELQERFTFIMAIETIRCVEEGVVMSTPDANIGSIFGIGFPSLYGGALQYVNQYDGGLPGFVKRAEALAAKHGARFTPPELLRSKAESGERF
jgi:3-hydroxyacyl-CoA dehydrogenase / enoyl-CoA hydratase / 3-hydroxybutyryl-CoA epimerase